MSRNSAPRASASFGWRRPCLRLPSTGTAATSISADAFARGSSGRPSASAIGTRSDAQSRPILYSLPRRRCYARHGVDRPASRHAGPRSLLPRPPQRSMEARPCSSPTTIFLSRLCDAPQRLCPDDPKRVTRSWRRSAVGESRKLAAILVSDVVGYSRLTGADEDRILARLRALRSDLIDPTIAVHHGRVVKRTGDGAIVEFRSVVDAVNCAIEVQRAMVERNAGVAPDKRIEFRIGIHLGDIVEEADGDLMGDGVNIAARLQGVAKPGGICLSEQAYWQVK